ncbi:MAG: hypothetical protein ABR505_12340 [Actinomycetota bacterium]
MRARRMDEVPRFGRTKVARDDPEILLLENLETDLPPPPGVIEATRAALGELDIDVIRPDIP